MNTEQTQPAPEREPEPVDIESDAPLVKACDLTGDTPCEACQ